MKNLILSFAIVAGLLCAHASPAQDAKSEEAKIKTARAQLALLSQAVDNYWVAHGRYPQDLQELLVKDRFGGPYLTDNAALFDPWGKVFSYDPRGDKNGGNRPDFWTTNAAKEVLGNWQDEPKLHLPKLEQEIKIQTASAQLRIITTAVDTYYVKHGRFPNELRNLLEGKPPLLKSKKMLNDPWNAPFRYDVSGLKNKGLRPDIWCIPPFAAAEEQSLGNWQDKRKFSLAKAQEDVNLHTARAQILLLTKAVKAYAALNGGKFPETLEKLTEGKKPFLEEAALIDPWGKRIQYDREGPRNEGKQPDIWCGPPRAQFDQDTLGNWPMPKD